MKALLLILFVATTPASLAQGRKDSPRSLVHCVSGNLRHCDGLDTLRQSSPLSVRDTPVGGSCRCGHRLLSDETAKYWPVVAGAFARPDGRLRRLSHWSDG